MSELIIRNVKLFGNKEYCDVEIINGVINQIRSSSLSRKAAIEIDGKWNFLGAGLINAHHHLDKALLIDKSPFKGGEIQERVNQVNDWKRNTTSSEVCKKAMKAISESIASGVTTLRTSVDIDPIWGLNGLEGLLAARQKSKNYIDIQIVAFAQEGIIDNGVTELMRKALEMGADAVGGHTDVEKNSIKHAQEIFKLANEFKVPIEFHVDESVDPNNTKLHELIEQLNLSKYNGGITFIHCLGLSKSSDDEINKVVKELLESSVKVIACPTIVSLGLPIVPACKLSSMGVTVACGSDNFRDPFSPLGEVSPIRLAKLLALLDGFSTEEELARLYKIITQNGANALGLEKIGAVIEGYKADLVLYDAKSVSELIINQKEPKWVIKNGNLVWASNL